MTEIIKPKQSVKLTTMGILALILISIVCLPLVPNTQAAEPNLQAKSLSFLSDVVGLNIKQYVIKQDQQYDDKLFGVPQKTADLCLSSAESSFRVTCTYVKDVLALLYLSDIEGNLKLAHPVTNTVDTAKSFLVSYLQESGDAVYGKFAQMLNNVNESGKTSMIADNVKLEASNPAEHNQQHVGPTSTTAAWLLSVKTLV